MMMSFHHQENVHGGDAEIFIYGLVSSLNDLMNNISQILSKVGS